jgi:hydrogenase nickel incorporation protein HypB
VALLSVTEGEDKPLKYPHMFRSADVILLSKVDLLPHLEFSPEVFLDHVREVNAGARFFRLSSTRGDGLPDWYDWLLSLSGARTEAAHA